MEANVESQFRAQKNEELRSAALHEVVFRLALRFPRRLNPKPSPPFDDVNCQSVKRHMSRPIAEMKAAIASFRSEERIYSACEPNYSFLMVSGAVVIGNAVA